MSSKPKAVVFAFRRPRFPVICDLAGDLFAALSPAALRRRLAGVDLVDNKKARFVDANGESWMLLQKKMIFAPKFFRGSGARSKSFGCLMRAARL